MNAVVTKQPLLQEIHNIKQSPQKADYLSSSLLAIASSLLSRKYAQAFAESAKLKLPSFQELTKIVYEYAHLRYLLMSKDKILQVNSEPHLLTQAGMVHLRTLAIYREEAGQAKTNYQAIAENINKILTSSSSYYHCTLPNRQELVQVKNSLISVFQQLKTLRKQKPLSASQATQKQRAKVSTTINECKEGFLEIISQLVPSMTLKQTTNRDKTILQLISLSKELIKEAVSGFRNEMELLRSRTLISEKTLQSERMVKLEKEREIEELKGELLTSQRMIEDLQGMKAATEMENLGLHSKIQTAGSDEEREIFEAEIERLRLEVEEWTVKATQAKEMERRWREEVQIRENEFEREREEKMEGLVMTCKALQEENSDLKEQLSQLASEQNELQRRLSHYKFDLLPTQRLLRESTQTLQTALQQSSQLKTQNHHYLTQLLKLQSSHKNSEELAQDLTKLQEEFEQIQADNNKLHLYLQQQEQKRSAYENLIEELSRLNEQAQQDKLRLTEELEACISDNDHIRDTAGLLQAKLKEMQEEYEYLMAEKDYYANSYHACTSHPTSQKDDAIHT